MDNITAFTGRLQLPSFRKARHLKVVAFVLAMVFCISNISSDQVLLSRQLAVKKSFEKEFRLLLVDVPDRVTSIKEDFFLEKTLNEYLKFLLEKKAKITKTFINADKKVVISNGVDDDTFSVSLLVTIAAQYTETPNNGIEGMIKDALNHRPDAIMKALANPQSPENIKAELEAAEYFKNLKNFECISTFENDDTKSEDNEPDSATGEKEVGDNSDSMTSSGQEESDISATQRGETETSVAQGRTKYEQQNPNLDQAYERGEREPDTQPAIVADIETDNQLTNDPNDRDAKKKASNPFNSNVQQRPNYTKDGDSPFNSEAAEFRTLTGFIFFGLCFCIFAWSAARMASKKKYRT